MNTGIAEESWKAISEMAQRESESLRSELAEKNKVLEWYGEEMPHAGSITSKVLIDKGQKARSILSQYATINKSEPEPDTAPGSSAT